MMTPDDWLKDIRVRLHDQGNHVMRLEGEMLADRRVADERHRQIESDNREIKADLSGLSQLVSSQNETMQTISQGQQSIIQRMDSDRDTRIATAQALEDAEKARRDRNDGPWVTPNRVIGIVSVLLAIAVYASTQLPG